MRVEHERTIVSWVTSSAPLLCLVNCLLGLYLHCVMGWVYLQEAFWVLVIDICFWALTLEPLNTLYSPLLLGLVLYPKK